MIKEAPLIGVCVELVAGREDGCKLGKARMNQELWILAGIQEDGLESVLVSHSL